MKIFEIFKNLFLYGLNPFSAQSSVFWSGTVTGDAGPYTADTFTDWMRKIFTNDRTTQGVIPDYLNELLVTNPAGTTIRTASGAAIVDGCFYENTANVDNSVVAPGVGSNYYTLVLDKDFVAQTVRISLLGPNPVAPPIVTQVDGTTWEIALAEIEITFIGVITVTDVRDYSHNIIADDAVTTSKILNGAVTAAKLTDGPGSGVDADTVDGYEATDIINSLTNLVASSDIVLSNVATLIPGMSAVLSTGTYLVIATVPMWISGSSGQYADINLQAFLDGVLQAGESDWLVEIPSSGRTQKRTLPFVWRVSVSGSQTLEIRAYKEVGSTAAVTTVWQIDKCYALRV
jgi:hypothetical protein